ncbi:hypothetical protein ACGF3G_00280 [Streptomyces sp. NPDC048179]|uniref:hypothetical protein n=1 Tax=Streptomyces sp. NPDC048179 TaxID=3365506 RepID=UPI003723B68B
MSKHAHTALKETARVLADEEDLAYGQAHRIVKRWATHEAPTDDQLRAADETPYDPGSHYAMTPPSETPGWLKRTVDYPVCADAPAPYCYARPVPSVADPEQKAVLSLFARTAFYGPEAALIVEPLTYTPPADTRRGAYGHWGHSWMVQLYDQGFRYDRVSRLAAPGWAATVTRGPEPSAPCRLRLAHVDGYVLFDEDTPLPPGWLARVGVHPEGVPIFCGPGAGLPVPPSLEQNEVGIMLESADLIVARVPFTVA